MDTSHIYSYLRAGSIDDAALNAMIRAMLSTPRRTADDHDVYTWRRDHYLDLRRWACPPLDVYLSAQAYIAAGGDLAIVGEGKMAEYNEARVNADYRFPPNPFIPDAEPVEPPTGDE